MESLQLWNLPSEILSIISSFLSLDDCLAFMKTSNQIRIIMRDRGVTDITCSMRIGSIARRAIHPAILKFKNLESFYYELSPIDINNLPPANLVRSSVIALPKSLTRLHISADFHWLLSPAIPTSWPIYRHLYRDQRSLYYSNALTASGARFRIDDWNPSISPWVDWEHLFPHLAHLKLTSAARINPEPFKDIVGDKNLGEWFMLSFPRHLKTLHTFMPMQTRLFHLLPPHLSDFGLLEMVRNYQNLATTSYESFDVLEFDPESIAFLDLLPESLTALSLLKPSRDLSLSFCHRYGSCLKTLIISMKEPGLNWKFILLLNSLETLQTNFFFVSSANEFANFNFVMDGFPPHLRTLHLELPSYPQQSFGTPLKPWIHLLPRQMTDFKLNISGYATIHIWPLDFSDLPPHLTSLAIPAFLSDDINQTFSFPRTLTSLTLYRSTQTDDLPSLDLLLSNLTNLLTFTTFRPMHESQLDLIVDPKCPIQLCDFVTSVDGQFFKKIDPVFLSRFQDCALVENDIHGCFDNYLSEISKLSGKKFTCRRKVLKTMTVLPPGILRLPQSILYDIAPSNLPSSLTILSNFRRLISSSIISTQLPNLKRLRCVPIQIDTETIAKLYGDGLCTTFSDAWTYSRILPHIKYKKKCTMFYENCQKTLEMLPNLTWIVSASHPGLPSIFDHPFSASFVPPPELEKIFALHSDSCINLIPVLPKFTKLTHLRIRLPYVLIKGHLAASSARSYSIISPTQYFISLLPPQLSRLEIIKTYPQKTNEFDLDSSFKNEQFLPTSLESLVVRHPTVLTPPYFSMLPVKLQKLYISQHTTERITNEQLGQFPPYLREIKFGCRNSRTVWKFLHDRFGEI